jgi:TolA-binding protein
MNNVIVNKSYYIASIILILFIHISKINGAVNKEMDKTCKLANSLFESQSYTLAKVEYLKIIAFYPDSEYTEDVLYKVGECLRQEGNYLTAIREWEKLTKNYPNSKYFSAAQKWIKYLNILIENYEPYEDYEPYPATVEELVANKYITYGTQAMQNILVTGAFGIVYRTEYIDEAFYWFNEAIKICPQDSPVAAKAHYKIGETYAYLSRHQDYYTAIEEYKKIVDNYSSNYWINKALMQIATMYEDYVREKNEAITAYTKTIVHNNYDLKNYYVDYACIHIKRLGGSLKFMETPNKEVK